VELALELELLQDSLDRVQEHFCSVQRLSEPQLVVRCCIHEASGWFLFSIRLEHSPSEQMDGVVQLPELVLELKLQLLRLPR
jgi:hypothetical protein